MDFDLSKPQKLLKQSARELLARECGAERVRQAMESETALDAALWQAVVEQGWTGLAVPEAFGGLGLGMVELAAVFEETGRVCMPGPLLSTTFAAALMTRMGMPEELEPVALGEKRATVAILERSADWSLDSIRCNASPIPEAFVIAGEKLFVPDADTADLILCVARRGDELLIVPVPRDASGLTIERMPSMDETRKLYRVIFGGVIAGTRGVLRSAGPALAWALDVATVALCAEMVGGMQWVLDTTVEYAKTRQQFGRVIGSFQAVQHQCADMLVLTESARSATYFAAWTLSHDPEAAQLAVSIAKAYCSDAYREVGNRGVQVHGGIGFTWEHDLQLYYKRARASATMFGDATFHRERIARAVVDEPRISLAPQSAERVAGGRVRGVQEALS
jgi:alkylation response protein AidB-like acyl-CoA dehydrogenase